MIWGRPVEASLSVARKKYVQGAGNPDKLTNMIPKVIFDRMVYLDPTPQKKYIQAMCHWLVDRALEMNHLDPVRDAVFSMKRPFISQDVIVVERAFTTPYGMRTSQDFHRVDIREMSLVLKRALELEKAHVKFKDPLSFRFLGLFRQHLDKVEEESNATSRSKLQNWLKAVKSFVPLSEVTFQNEKCLVVKLMNFPTANKIAEGLGKMSVFRALPHWCVAQQEGHWWDYLSGGSVFYFLISKTSPVFYAVEVKGLNFNLWEESGDRMDKSSGREVLERYGVFEKSSDIFSSFEPEGQKTLDIGVLFLDTEDSEWSGWGLDFSEKLLSADTMIAFYLDLGNYLSVEKKTPGSWLYELDKKFELGVVLGIKSEFEDEDAFIAWVQEEYNGRVGKESFIRFQDDPNRDTYLRGLWSDYLDRILSHGIPGSTAREHDYARVTISTRWLESKGIHWDYDKYDPDDLAFYLGTEFGRMDIQIQFKVDANTEEVDFKLDPPDLEDFDMYWFNGKQEAYCDLVLAVMYHTETPPDSPVVKQTSFMGEVLNLVREWQSRLREVRL